MNKDQINKLESKNEERRLRMYFYFEDKLILTPANEIYPEIPLSIYSQLRVKLRDQLIGQNRQIQGTLLDLKSTI